MTYTDFVTAIEAALVIDASTDTDFVAYIPRLIEQAELRCYRDLDLVAMRKSATASLAAGTATTATPTDWLLGRRIWVTATGATARRALTRRDEEYMLEYWPDPALTAPPKFWTEQTAGTLIFAPTFDLTYTVQYLYTIHPPTLSGTNTSTVLSVTFPDLFFAAAMYFGAAYQKNFGAASDNPQAAMSWEATYKELLTGALREEARRKGEGYFDVSQSAPPAADTGRGG